MLIRRPYDIKPSEITGETLYRDRREFIRAAAALAAAGGLAAAGLLAPGQAHSAAKFADLKKGPFATDETLTAFESITNYNNYYEFGTDKEDPAD